MFWNLVVPVTGVVGIVPAGIRLRTECIASTGCAKRWRSRHSTARRVGRVRRLSSHRRTRGQNEEDNEQKDEEEAMKSAEIAQADEIRFGGCVHDVVLSEIEKERVATCDFVMINITINSDCSY